MSSLLSTLWISLGALQAQQAGLQTTANNVANINTAGYSRERPIFQEAAPVVEDKVVFGGGVELTGIESLRSDLLDLQVSDETQQQSNSQAYVNAMNQVQTLFPDDTTGIGAGISAFFQSLNSLSTNPSDLTLRQAVLTAASNMSTDFNNASNQLSGVSSSLNAGVQQQVQEVNGIAQQIAAINVKLAATSSSGEEYSSYLDQRSALIAKLSGTIDVAQINDGNGVTLTTKQGVPLVVDGTAYALSTEVDSSGTQHIYSSQDKDITSDISGGSLGGTLQARDQTIPTLQSQLDSLASGIEQRPQYGARDGDGPERQSGLESFCAGHRLGFGVAHGGSHYRSKAAGGRVRRIERQQRQHCPPFGGRQPSRDKRAHAEPGIRKHRVPNRHVDQQWHHRAERQQCHAAAVAAAAVFDQRRLPG